MQTRRFPFPLPCPMGEILAIASSSWLGLAAGAEVAPDAAPPILGFSRANAAHELTLEQKFDAQLEPSEQRAWLERMSAEPNHVGSPHNKANAEFMLEQFRQWGWDAHLETFYVLYPTPRKVALELIAPTQFAAGLHEPAM